MIRFWLGTIFVSLFFTTPAVAELALYLSAPGVQTAESSGLTGSTFLTETFQSQSTGSVPTGMLSFSGSSEAANGGTYVASGAQTINANNVYGGYAQGDYLAINGLGATMTITFDTGVNYFGFLWTAGDASNRISFYDDTNALLATYSTASLLTLLPNNNTSTIDAVDGSTYFTGNYYGKPTATGPNPLLAPNDPAQIADGGNSSEPYAYLHFMDTLGSNSISKVVIEKSANGGNFENDNHSISFATPDVDDSSLVLISGAIPVPEPSSALLVGVTGMVLLLGRSRRR